MASFSAPVGDEFSGSSCVRTRVVRGFTILALIFTSMAFVAAWLGANSIDDIMYRSVAVCRWKAERSTSSVSAGSEADTARPFCLRSLS